MADDFERAVLIGFTPGAVDAGLKARAEEFVEQVKRSPQVQQLCCERFTVTNYAEIKFWCLQTLHEVIRSSYGTLPGPAQDMIKNALLTWVTRDCNNSQQPLPPFLRNKVAQTLVAVLQHEYPRTWPGFFQDLLRAILPGSQLASAGEGGQASGTLGHVAPGSEGLVDMFCRILVSVDEDLVSLDIPRSQDESKLSMHVKDSMREHSIADIAAAWQLLVEVYSVKSPELATLVLTTMQRYISWIDIALVANPKNVALLQAVLEAPGTPATLRGAAADCLSEVVAKRMDAVAKLNLVRSMGIVPRCATWAGGWPVACGRVVPPGSLAAVVAGDDEAQELLLKLARLLCALAGEMMDTLKRVENGVISLTAMGLGVSEDAAEEAQAAANQATQLLDLLFPAVLSAFRSEVDEVALPLLPFMTAYVARLKVLQKRNNGLSPVDLQHVHEIFDGIVVCARYPRVAANNHYQGTLPPGQVAGRPMSPTSNGGGRLAAANGHGHAGVAVQPLPVSAAAKDEQSEVEEKRGQVFILYRNLAKTVYPEALIFLRRLLEGVLATSGAAGAPAWQDVEIALTLLYEVGEAGIDDMAKPDCGALAPLVTALAHACTATGGAATGQGLRPLPAAGHRLVSLVVLELLVRFGRVLQQSPGLLLGVLPLFLDHRGMGHESEDVSVRACYLFCRLAKALRSQMGPLLPSLLPSLQPHLERVATTPLADQAGTAQAGRDTASKASAPSTAVVDDRLYVWEAAGLLLGPEEVAAEPQAAALAALLQPLSAQIQVNLRPVPTAAGRGPLAGLQSSQAAQGQQAPGPALIVQALEAVVRLSKGFKTDLLIKTRPQLGAMFAEVMEVALAIPHSFPNHRLLRARFISFLHRLVEALQGLLLPYLPRALEALVCGPQGDITDLTDVLVLSNQLACKYKEQLAPLMAGLLPIVVPRLHALLGTGWDWSGRTAAPSVLLTSSQGAGSGTAASAPSVSATLEEARERGEAQRAYYSLLHAVAHQGLSGVLLKQDPAQVLEPIMAALTRGAAAHVDPAARRTCVQVYCRLVTEWCTSGSAEALPGFRRYAMEHLGGEAAVLGVLRSSPPLDPRDGATLALLQDLATALKLVHERCGEEFEAHLLGVVAPAAGLPQHLAEQFVLQVRSAEAKDIRDSLKAMLLQQALHAASVQGQAR